jgi:ferrous iron transport protein B
MMSALKVTNPEVAALLNAAQQYRAKVGGDPHELIVETLYQHAAWVASRAVKRGEGQASPATLEQRIDRIVTSRRWGFPIMLLLLTGVFWLTISGANIPSGLLSSVLVDAGHPWLREVFTDWHAPWWLTGMVVDGMYLATAWVVSVMLPPMAIFFPLFTLLEDLGYLPRVAFNLDRLFRAAGAHGKQAMSMMMGFGCNGRFPAPFCAGRFPRSVSSCRPIVRRGYGGRSIRR